MSQTPPTTLGKYQIIREIARSNDIVFEAWDPIMNRRVAVKELAVPGGSSDKQRDERLQRFHREARAAGGLVHPNIVTIYEVSQEADRHFIAMEYLDGRNLRQELDSGGAVPPIRALEIAIDVLKGLGFSHSKGVVHRDIKPDNIQLLANGSVKITDFGIARLTFEPNLTMDGQVFGTPSYMSPEQIHGREIDARSDLFSVGVILYEMVSGTKPFTGDSVVSITYSIMNTQPVQPPQVSHSLWMTISRALDKSPQMRPGSADEMRGMLESVVQEMRSGSVVQAPVQTMAYGATPQVISGPPPVLYAPQQYAPQQYAPQQYQPAAPTHQPGQIYVQPYVPGGGAPNMAPPSAGGGATPYNPYGAPVQLPQGLPIYYPPPPKTPLISTEARQVFVKLLLTLVILGTIAALGIMVINASTSSARGGSAPPAGVPQGQVVPLEQLDSRIQTALANTNNLSGRPVDDNLRDPIYASAREWQGIAQLAGPNGDRIRHQAAVAFIILAEARGGFGDSYNGRIAATQAASFAIGDPELRARAEDTRRRLGG
jgi:serine/threonine-protein kinase